MTRRATGGERQTLERFSARYRLPENEDTRAVELAVIGGDWGANGYTTRAQADQLGQVLALGPGMRLLDVGAGRGWPGLYLAQRTGCSAVLSDIPVEGLRAGARRGRAAGLDRRVTVVVAGARHPPFPPGSFDAVVHTDVLC